MLLISPEKRKTTSYCRASLCLFISRILVKPISFDSEVRPKTPESHIILTVNTLRRIQGSRAYVKRREKQQREQQHINTSQYHNYPTAHYSFMKMLKIVDLSMPKNVATPLLHFALSQEEHQPPQKTCCPILNPNRCCSFFSAVKNILKLPLLIDLTRQQNRAELPSLARA